MDSDKNLAPFALDPEKRKNELGSLFRENEPEDREDEFRNAYHRDRDRIIWSTAFRRMQNKTQVFAHDDDDHFRRRLTHSIEVAGIACSIARQLKLNEEATDAIALGHDIGHAPFGHAGEDALNDIMKGYNFPDGIKEVIPLKGFDHCAHAIEVVSRIETLNGTYSGLGLTFDIRDGILKHIYHNNNGNRDKKYLEEKPFSDLSEIIKCEKYSCYECNFGSLEAQCVWFADKLTYLFDDMEDAVRAKIFGFNIIKHRKLLEKLKDIAQTIEGEIKNKFDIEEQIPKAIEQIECDIVKAARECGLACIVAKKFKEHYSSEKMKELYDRSDKIQVNHPNDDVRQFLFWRNKAMTVMIKDCVKATNQRITMYKIKSLQDVFGQSTRLVDVSDDLKGVWRENENNFYKCAMANILFKHRIVLKHTYNAGQKIWRLFEIYRGEKGYELIPKDYKNITKDNYNTCDFGVNSDNEKKEIFKAITIRNYIAGMTDAYVNQKLEEYGYIYTKDKKEKEY